MHPLSLLERLEAMAGEGGRGPIALATVLEVEGSVPRRPGAMMVLGPGGLEAGTVGGGAMEAKVLAALASVLGGAGDRGAVRGAGADAAPVRRESIDLGGDPVDVRDGICGGRMTVEVRRLGVEDAAAVARVAERLRAGHAAALIGTARGLEAGDAAADAAEGFAHDADGDAWTLTMRPRPLLLVVGGGHCGEALARQARLLDFDVMLEDDRDAVRARIEPSPGVRVVAGPTSATLAAIPPGRELLVALVTRSFRQDLAALDALREGGGADYVGVMGSGRRLGTVFALLRERGWTAGELRRLDAPIGLDIGAETPAEIAVSIAARLVAHRAARTAKPSGRPIAAGG